MNGRTNDPTQSHEVTKRAIDELQKQLNIATMTGELINMAVSVQTAESQTLQIAATPDFIRNLIYSLAKQYPQDFELVVGIRALEIMKEMSNVQG